MKTIGRQILLLVLAAATVSAQFVERFTPETWRKNLEASWQIDAEARANAGQPNKSTQGDAAGGCDGIKNGKYGFHTGNKSSPWWQVDLGESKTLAKILIWNRCDSPDRTKHLRVLLSQDGNKWETIYTHDGKKFLGYDDNKPLEIKLAATKNSARFVRVQLPGKDYLHLDEVEVFGANHPDKNLALHRAADQSSTSQWSGDHFPKRNPDWAVYTRESLAGCQSLLGERRDAGVNVVAHANELKKLNDRVTALTMEKISRTIYFEARTLQRKLALANPLLDFDKVIFTKRKLGTFSHMSDQFYGWWSRGGGGVYVLENFKSDSPALKCLTSEMSEGSFLRPELSYDGTKIIFAYCKFYPEVAANTNKVDKMRLPEDSFYHVFEMNVDGSGLRQLTRGHYNDFDARYLPNGEIVFLSTRRGQFVQSSQHCATRTLTEDALPDSYVRCGGGDWRPVSVYTLHVMNTSGGNLRAISPFENFEWTPAVACDGRIFYSRWDYVDRNNMPYMSLWSTNPDGTNPQLVYGNFTVNPYAVLEARPVPNSRKIVFTASAHHSYTAGTLVLLDPTKGKEGSEPLRRLTPEVCFPEIECWPTTWYAGPYPLSENYFLTAWSNESVKRENLLPPENGAGIYLYDAFGNRDVLYRDDAISSMDPIPLRAQKTPPLLSSNVEWDGAQEGKFLLQNVYDGLDGVKPGEIKNLRIVAVPAKTQPQMNQPNLGMTRDDPGKTVLGTVPVESDGSAYFRVPSGVNVFFQALDANGYALQTMRTLTYVQPNQTLSCIGCHESRNSSPQNYHPIASTREPSKILTGPEGSWPLRFDKLVQPVLDKNCVSCHNAKYENQLAAKFDLSTEGSYERLVSYGEESLKQHIGERYQDGKSLSGSGPAKTSALLAYLKTDVAHQSVKLDKESSERLITWMDTYAQRLGSFSAGQENDLEELKRTMASLLEKK